MAYCLREVLLTVKKRDSWRDWIILTSRCHIRCHSVEAEKPGLCEGKGGDGKKQCPTKNGHDDPLRLEVGKVFSIIQYIDKMGYIVD